jgi:2-octaprenyl-6-methoxyphenol hydroxylase
MAVYSELRSIHSWQKTATRLRDYHLSRKRLPIRDLDSLPTELHPFAVSEEVEMLIAGGGLIGLLLGTACAGAGLAVAIVDPADPAAVLDEGFDGRCSAIAYGSSRVLDALGLWSEIGARAEPILEIRVADDESPLFLHYDHRQLGIGAPLGYVVENLVLRHALIERARSLPNLSFLVPLAVGSVETSALAAVATLSDGRRVGSRLIVAADGQKSRLRQGAGIGEVEWRYGQTSIVTTVRHERPHGGTAVEHFLPAGPFAILPMDGNRSSIVWTERVELAARLVGLSDAAFAAEIAVRFGDYLGAVEPIGRRWTYPLGLMLAERYIAGRLVLVGEAAHVIHPIAGQGFNLGIRDIAALAELVIDRRRLGLDIGDDAILVRYQQWRRFDSLMLAAVTDGLNRLFSNSTASVQLARDVGFAAVHRLPPLKRLLMRDAMGIVGELPRLVRGEPL